MLDFKELFRYGKGRIIITLYSYVLVWFFVDYVGLKFWFFGIFWIPFNFIVGYYINKRTFKKEEL